MTDAPTPIPPPPVTPPPASPVPRRKRPWTILGRLTAAVRGQNWFAVVLELVILVLGVVIGLQANNQNQERIARRAETDLLERLHLDVQAAQDRFASWAEDRLERQAHLRTIADVFFDSTMVRPLTADECYALANAHIITFPPVDIPTLAEVTLGGQIRLVASDSVRHSVLDLEQANGRARAVFDFLNSKGIDLARVHPDLLATTIRREQEGISREEDGRSPYWTAASCAHREMSASASFRNDLVGSVRRNEGYVAVLIKPLAEALSALHTSLDAELSIHHHEETHP